MAFLYGNDVNVGLCCGRIIGFICKCILAYRKPCFKCIVSVEDYICGIGDRILNALCCKLDDLDLNIVRLDIVNGSGESRTLSESKDSVILKQKKCSCFIGGIVGNCNLITVCDIIKA